METIPSPPVLIVSIRPGAPVPRALETIKRLIALSGSSPTPPQPTPTSTRRSKLVLLKGGK